jgi:Mg/Co/Ni transporter MgtE
LVRQDLHGMTAHSSRAAMLPIAARACKLDPAVVSSPSLASTVDVSGMVIYFTTATFILNL